MISFLNPGFLFGFLLLGPVLVLYFIKSKPVRKVISSNILWRMVLSRIHPNSFLQKFHNSLFLFLQILAITLAVLAMGRPVGLFSSDLSRIIILDVSASMSASDAYPSRFEQAREAAEKLVSGFSGRVALYVLNDKLEKVVGFSESRSAVFDALGKVTTTHFSTPSSDKVLRMIHELEGLGPHEIFVLTDTPDLDFPPEFMPRTAISVQTFGTSSDNVAIVDSESFWDPEHREIRSTIIVKNFNSVLVKVSIRAQSQPIGNDDDGNSEIQGFPLFLDLLPHEEIRVRLPPLPNRKNTIIMSVPTDRNFSRADDRWYFCNPGLKPKVLIKADSGSILFKLSQALPLVDFVHYVESMLASDAAAIILKGDRPDSPRSVPEGARDGALSPADDAFAAISGIPVCCFCPGTEKLGVGEILPWEKDHPLMKFLNWDAVPVESIAPGDFSGFPIVEGIRGKILSEEIVSERNKNVTLIRCGFDPDHQSLAGSIFLPVFLYNVVEYLLKDSFPRLSYPVGSPLLRRLWRGVPPSSAGFHEIPFRPNSSIALNLESPSEADLSPAGSKQPTPSQSVEKTVREQAGSPWQAFLCVGFLVLLGEWFLFMRRS